MPGLTIGQEKEMDGQEYTKDIMFQVPEALLLGSISSASFGLKVFWNGTCPVKIAPQKKVPKKV